jgi:hypothetical protein
MATILNLTPHVINVFDMEGNHVKDIPVAEGMPTPRVSQSQEFLGELDGIPITRQFFGQVENLPEPQSGVFLVVSRMVAQAIPEREDLLVPGPLVRNEQGQPCGCHGLSRI